MTTFRSDKEAFVAETLRADDFEGFFASRMTSLLGRIEKAMGKPVAGREAVATFSSETAMNGDEDELDQPETSAETKDSSARL